jgi:fructose-1,6-bisphosphatase II
MSKQECICSRFVSVTEAAALAASDWIGKGDGLAAGMAAQNAMVETLSTVPFCGRVVAGRSSGGTVEGLGVGHLVGAHAGSHAAAEAEQDGTREAAALLDLAVAPLEGHRALARGVDGALAMIAAGPRGSLMPVPEMYMQKLVVAGPAAGVINIDEPIAKNVKAVATALGRAPGDLTVAVLDRPQHEDLIEEIRCSGARLKLMDEGDVSAGISAAALDSDVDIYVGIGGSTEGIVVAAALRCLGGEMQARFWPVSRHQVETIKKMGIGDVEATLRSKDMAGEGVLVAATAVTRGRFLRGVEKAFDGTRTETLVMCSLCDKIQLVKTIHREPGTPSPVTLWTA